MPVYKSNTYMTSLLPGQSLILFNAEQPAPGNAGITSGSIAFAASPSPVHDQISLAFDGSFAGAPGAFEVDVQVCDGDPTVDANFQTVANGNITAVDATNNTFHFDFKGFGRFFRALLRSRANAVNLTLQATHA